MLIETEARSKSNTHRLDDLEHDVKNNNTLALNVRELTIEIKHMREDYQKLAEKHAEEVRAIDTRLTEVEKKPGKKWENLVGQVVSLVVGALISYVLLKIGL